MSKGIISKKIPTEMYMLVYNFYQDKLDKGVGVTKIADLFNAQYKTDFAEASLRNRYEYQRDLNNIDSELVERLADLEEAERTIALKEMNIVSKQKKIQRQQSAIDSQLRYNADKELVAEVFNQQERQEFEPIDLTYRTVKDTYNCPIFVGSDLHLGYMEQGYYDLQQAKDNLTNFFKHINKEIKDKKLKEIVIAELGDMIEGSTLRATQLFTIAEVMTKQATIFIDLYTGLLKQLSNDNPNTFIRVLFVDEDNHSQIRLTGASRGDTTEQVSKVIANDIRRTVETAHEYGGMENVEFIHAGEIVAEVNGATLFLTHGDKYARNEDAMLKKIYAIHGIIPDVIIRAHFHSYAHITRNVVDGFMQVTITTPPLCGDSRYGREGLGLTGLAGFMRVDISDHTATSKFVKV